MTRLSTLEMESVDYYENLDSVPYILVEESQEKKQTREVKGDPSETEGRARVDTIAEHIVESLRYRRSLGVMNRTTELIGGPVLLSAWMKGPMTHCPYRDCVDCGETEQEDGGEVDEESFRENIEYREEENQGQSSRTSLFSFYQATKVALGVRGSKPATPAGM